MYKLILFLLRYRILLLFVALESICFTLIINYHSYHRPFFINSSNFIAGSALNSIDRLLSYLSQGAANKQLSEENAKLHTLIQSIDQDNYPNEYQPGDSLIENSYLFIPAKVINNSIYKTHNFLTLNKGKNHGIRKDMGVISSTGVVGIVIEVSQRFSTVKSILNKDIKVSSILEGSNYFGPVIWDGVSPQNVSLTDIPSHVHLRKDMLVKTSGHSLLFPENVMIGRVNKYSIDPESGFYKIDVLLSTSMQSLSYVYVIKAKDQKEKKELEDLTNVE